MAHTSAEQPGASGGAEKTRRLRSRRLIVSVVALCALVIYAIPYYFTSSPAKCATCHSMKPFYESWKASSHNTATTGCVACHVRRGTFNLIAYRLMFYWEIVAEVTGIDGKPWGVMIPGVESCRGSGCHSLNRVVSTSADLRISHREHVVKARLSCVKCHPGAAHKGVGKRFLLPPRKLCSECHKKEMDDCGYCHIQRVRKLPPEVH